MMTEMEMLDLETSKEYDDDDEEVFFGEITTRERKLVGDSYRRRTEVFNVQLRQSLMVYRRNKIVDDNASEHGQGTTLQNLDEDIAEEEKVETESLSNEANLNSNNASKIDEMDIIESSIAETTFFTCCESIQSHGDYTDERHDKLLSSDEFQQLVVPPVSRASSFENMAITNDDSIVKQKEREGFCDDNLLQRHPEELNSVVSIESLQIVDNLRFHSSLHDSEDEEYDKIDEVIDKENFIQPKTVTQSCQTSFIEKSYLKNDDLAEDRFRTPGADNLKVTNPSPFKTPLSVSKPPNTANKTSSLKKQQAKGHFIGSFASPKLNTPKFSPQSDKRFNHIVSPISQYINEAPPPPLITNIRSKDVKKNSTPKKPILRSASRQLSNLPVRQPISNRELSLLESSTASSSASSVSDESILERFGLTVDDFNKVEDKSLKRAIKNYVKQEKLSGSKKASVSNCATSLIPVANYRAPMALAAVPMGKELDLLTKVITFKNSKLPMPTPRPVVMKHIGERKKLHWASHITSTKKNKIKSNEDNTPIIIKLPQRLDDSCMPNEESMVEVSMVEVATSSRTNTLFMK